ncbi:MFS transporter [Paeniglutamicibacter sp. ABSL32-1]|uniref:MFS transporter n=1 Tax=Paeniglutamicibacter quisquiliarum TaxID=2849498 RepID=UPI001C2CCA10|nr:MFS transporter [Paeniglutamicibacter quisquiliarum]MBV1778139.1 MFS transporter [Paeniglutamicibacter quisquiliarum]
MPLTPPRQKLAGRIGALLGIILMALSLRAAVVSVPPLLGSIGPELGFNSFSTGLLAMLAPVVFAAFGLLTPRLIRWWGLEKVLVAAVLLAVAGQLLRAVVGDVASFLLLSAITLAGYGMGNVVLPPLVKKYFPDRLAIVTSGYVTMLAVGTWMAPQFSVPLADAAGNWRPSIAAWALLSALVLLPWAIQLFRDRRNPRPDTPLVNGLVAAPPARINPWKSPVAWGLAIFLAGNSAQTYVYFTWLPPYLSQQGLDTQTAGSMLALFAILGLPVSLLVPLWVPRLRHPIVAVLVFTAFWIAGHLGMYLSPTEHTALWVVFAGLGQGTFAIALLMMNLRSRSTYGSGVLAGFSQGLGYAGAAVAPLLFGIVKDATGGWTASFAMLGICLAVMLAGAVMINGPRKIEDGQGGAERLGTLERVS